MSDESGHAVAAADAEKLIAERTKGWVDMTEAFRRRAEISSKALVGLGTSALTAVGIAKFSDIFPLPPWYDLELWAKAAVLAVPLGFVGMIAAIVLLGGRLWRVNEPIFVQSDPDLINNLSTGERLRVRRVFSAAAALLGVPSLRAYDARARRYERISLRCPDPAHAAELAVLARRIRVEVCEVQERAVANVVRLRAQAAVKGRGAVALAALFLVGLFAFGIGADYLDSERSARVAAAEACARAVESVRESSPATARLVPRICGGRAAVEEAP